MTFVLGGTSEANMRGVHPDIQRIVRRAITITTVDFGVIEGRRTEQRQAQLFAAKATKTLNSKHITGDAVDLAAWVGGRHSWDWPLYYEIAEAVRRAAIEENVRIRWGGVWDRILNDIEGDLDDAVAEYVARQKARGMKAFLDGPHFERFDA